MRYEFLIERKGNFLQSFFWRGGDPNKSNTRTQNPKIWNKEAEAHLSPRLKKKVEEWKEKIPIVKLYHSNNKFPLELRKVNKGWHKKFTSRETRCLLPAGLQWAHGAEQCSPLPLWGTQPHVSHKIMAAHNRKVAAVIHKSSSPVSPLCTPRKEVLLHACSTNNLLWKLHSHFLCTAHLKNLRLMFQHSLLVRTTTPAHHQPGTAPQMKPVK